MSNNIVIAAAAAAALCMALPAQGQSLIGSQVTGAGYCCTAPDESYRVTNLLTATVGPGIEFPAGSFESTGGQLETVLADIDVGATTLEIDYTASATAAPGTFNGFVFTFAGAPVITGVSADPTSTYSPVLSFNGNTIFVNEAGLDLTPASRVLINVSAVPEPAAFAMLFGGLGLVGLARWRRNLFAHMDSRNGGAWHAG
jgi:hypothetical protein